MSPSHQPNGVPGSGDVNADFSQMMDDLNDLSSHCPMFTKAPISGEMCRARFSVDDRWYRGLIVTSFPADEMAIVLYIDYGNSEAIPLTRYVAVVSALVFFVYTHTQYVCINNCSVCRICSPPPVDKLFQVWVPDDSS